MDGAEKRLFSLAREEEREREREKGKRKQRREERIRKRSRDATSEQREGERTLHPFGATSLFSRGGEKEGMQRVAGFKAGPPSSSLGKKNR